MWSEELPATKVYKFPLDYTSLLLTGSLPLHPTSSYHHIRVAVVVQELSREGSCVPASDSLVPSASQPHRIVAEKRTIKWGEN